MDTKTLKELGGTVLEITVPFAGKMWNRERTVGGDWGMRITVAADHDPEPLAVAGYEYLKQIAGKAMHEDIEGMKQEQAQEPAPVAADKPGEQTFVAVKFELMRRKDKKYELHLFPSIKGAPGKYPELRYVAEQEQMFSMLQAAIEDKNYDLADLPCEYECNWLCHWQKGREFKREDGTTGQYKDLIAIQPM